MSIISWLKNTLAGEPAEKMEFAVHELHLHGLCMKTALDAHEALRIRLAAQIKGNAREKLSPATVSAADNCLLGHWLDTDGRHQFGSYTEYDELRQAHAALHRCAGGILKLAHSGNYIAASDALIKDYAANSEAVQLALVRLYAREADQQDGLIAQSA